MVGVSFSLQGECLGCFQGEPRGIHFVWESFPQKKNESACNWKSTRGEIVDPTPQELVDAVARWAGLPLDGEWAGNNEGLPGGGGGGGVLAVFPVVFFFKGILSGISVRDPL